MALPLLLLSHHSFQSEFLLYRKFRYFQPSTRSRTFHAFIRLTRRVIGCVSEWMCVCVCAFFSFAVWKYQFVWVSELILMRVHNKIKWRHSSPHKVWIQLKWKNSPSKRVRNLLLLVIFVIGCFSGVWWVQNVWFEIKFCKFIRNFFLWKIGNYYKLLFIEKKIRPSKFL